MVAILDAGAVGCTRRLERVVTRHRGRLVVVTGDGARAEFPGPAEALSAAIEFRQIVANSGGQAEDVDLFLHLGQPQDRAWKDVNRQGRSGGIVVTAALREAVAGRVRASFAELGSAGLGTVEQPVHLYEVGWDPADWPAAAAAAATPIASSSEGRASSRWVVAIAWFVLLAGALHLAAMPPPAASRLPGAERLNRPELERQAEAAFAQWLQEQNGVEQHEPEEGPPTLGTAPPTDAYDGVYMGTTAMRADGRTVTFSVKVANGIGSGTQTRLDCGVAPLSLRIAPWGDVTGMVLMFGSTCLKTELAIRGRAVGGSLLLRIGNQFVELRKPEN